MEGRLKRHEILLCGISALLALPAFAVGRALLLAIQLSNNLFFHGSLSLAANEVLPRRLLLLFMPALGGLFVGLIARYGSEGVRGHGIPEVIESVLKKGSLVDLKTAILKPLCSAIAIGSGGPFGAEGPVIGLGASLGSLSGQALDLSPWERKVLLSAGAAAGITAVFGCPIAATLLVVELLLFEFTPASLCAVGLASAVSEALRLSYVGTGAVFAMPTLPQPGAGAFAFYAFLGLPLGLAAAAIVHAVRASEHAFERLPLPWYTWPTLGGLAVGALALLDPRILGPSYSSLEAMLNGGLLTQALVVFTVCKLAAWLIALGSGTTGGTLAPLLGIGGGLGALLCGLGAAVLPGLGLDPRLGALIGMAALFAGASHALLASAIMLLEVTQQYSASLPLLAACLLANLVCQALLPHSLMTEGPARRGVRIPGAH